MNSKQVTHFNQALSAAVRPGQKVVRRGCVTPMRPLVSVLFALLLFGSLRVGAVEPFVKTITGLSTDRLADNIVLQQAVVDPADGSLLVAGKFTGVAHFAEGIDLTAADATGSSYDIFVAAQDPNGAWLWAVKPYSPTGVGAYVQQTTITKEVSVKDIKVSPANLYIAGTVGDRSPRAGFVVKLTKKGAPVWTRYVGAADATVNAVAVGPNDQVYVGGSFNIYLTSNSTRSLEVLSSQTAVTPRPISAMIGTVSPANYDAFIFKLNADGSMPAASSLLAGSADPNPEETVALECDAAGQLHVLMNLGGGTTPGFVTAPHNDVFVQNFDGTFFGSPIRTTSDGRKFYGDLVPFAGVVSAGGKWLAANALDTTSDLGALMDIPNSAPNSSFPQNDVRGTDLKLINGKAYVCGTQEYSITLNGVRQVNHIGFIVRLLAEDYTPDGPAAYFVPGGVDAPSNPNRIRGSENGIFITGPRSKTLQVFEADHAAPVWPPTPAKELTALTTGEFVGKLDLDLQPQWLRTTSLPNDNLPPAKYSAGMLAYDSANQRVYWGGSFVASAAQPLVLGDPPNLARLDTGNSQVQAWGWLTALSPDGAYLQRARLTVNSPYGPIVVNNSAFLTNILDRIYFQGTSLSVRVYDQTINNGGTRLTVTGYTLDNQLGTTAGDSVTLNLLFDTAIQFRYRTEHLLNIASDHKNIGLIADASAGNPVPLLGQSWIADGETVKATISGSVEPIDQNQWGDRYVVKSYSVSLPTLKTNPVDLVVDRLKVEEFVMTGPATIAYSWKKQHRLSVNDDSDTTLSLPLTRQFNGTTLVSQVAGSGIFWFDDKSTVQLSALDNDTAAGIALRGWRFAEPVATGYFPVTQFLVSDPNVADSTELATNLTSNTISGKAYWTKTIPSFTNAASIIWDYSDKIYTIHAAIGQPVTPPSIPGKTFPKVPWLAIRLVDAPPGSTVNDMLVWDKVAKQAVALRPGIFLVDWDDGVGGKVVTQVFTGFVGDAYQDQTGTLYSSPIGNYRHIANTPPVDLDPDPADTRLFQELKFTSGDGTAAGGKFTASVGGRSVLLFYTSVTGSKLPATGDPTKENVDVRVVETRLWNDSRSWTGTGAMLQTGQPAATIGAKLTSTFDTAGLGTGYVLHKLANYNADIYDRKNVQGPIIPVNFRITAPDTTSDKELVVVWYENRDGIRWPYQPAFYGNFKWPTAPTSNTPTETELKRIVIASRLGSEGLDAFGNRQINFDPELYTEVKIYNQPDRGLPGFNPNEEHARIYQSLHAGLLGKSVPAAFALRDDLNISLAMLLAKGAPLTTNDYTSDPYVLVQYFDVANNEPKMAIYAVQREDSHVNDPYLSELPGAVVSNYVFRYTLKAGELITPPYPLNLVIGLNPCANSVPTPYSPVTALPNGTYFETNDPSQRAWFIDHKLGAWAVAGGSSFTARYFYRLQSDFWYPFDKDVGNTTQAAGDCIPLLPSLDFTLANKNLGVFDTDNIPRTQPVGIRFDTVWPDDLPVLKVGETLTYPGGEYKADHPDAAGLPGIIGFAAGEIVFDSKNPLMDTARSFNNFMGRLIAPLEERKVSLPTSTLPSNLVVPSADVTVDGDTWYFNKLPPSLQKRVFFKPLSKLNASDPPGVLGLRGYVNDRTLGASDLTASPPPVYVLEPNVLTQPERDALRAADVNGSSSTWASAVEALYALSRNPQGLAGNGWNVGLTPVDNNPNIAKPLRGLGPGLALVTNPGLLDPANKLSSGYLTIAENNDESLGDAPITMHVIRIDLGQRYRGAIKTILPPNVFDEKITLRHTADFGGNVDALAFSWWYHEEDGTVQVGDVPPGPNGNSPAWSAFIDANGVAGLNQIDLNGNPTLLLADNLFFVHYRFNSANTLWSDWAGAANSSILDLNNDKKPDYRAQLATGWVKRVLNGINPYEARVHDFGKESSPSTAASLVQQLGGPFVGPVALNAAKDTVENLGLIELYETVLKRARDLSIDASQPAVSSGINAAILLASTRLADFYTLLGHEAWDDALDPTIGFGNGSIDAGNLNSTHFCFENQFPTLLDEELALLRGVDESFGRPVFNRLLWNFTKGEGEVAYALNYQIADLNKDGFIDENDAAKLYPMGHGDAWGHYLSAMRKRYDLLTAPNFNWEARSEYYNLVDVVVGVDYNDERNFARTALARAQVGAEIVDLTFRSRYSTAPNSKLSGYTDSDSSRAWGVTEWARRAGQAALFDWITANALLPAVDTNEAHSGISKLDRSMVPELVQIPTQFGAIQLVLDSANSGLNAIGLDPNVVPFDFDPTHLDVGSTAQVGTQPVQGQSHFEQIFQRAFEALRNASGALTYANEQKTLERQVEQSSEQLRKQAVAQDLEFRNRLIDIFGTPYEGTIGAGKAYPSGYNGPDLNLFMYVDVNAITPETVPVADNAAYFDEYVSFYDLTNDVPAEFQADISGHFFTNFTTLDQAKESNISVELLGDDLIHLSLPATAGDYTFTAPASWGQRAAPGRLQTMVSAMLQVQSDLALSVGDYDFLIKQLRDKVEVLKIKTELNADELQLRRDDFTAATTLKAVIAGLNIAKTAADHFAEEYRYTAFGIAQGLPTVVGVDNDPSFIPRAISYVSGNTAASVSEALGLASESTAILTDLSLEASQQAHELQFIKDGMSLEVIGMLKDIEELLVNEGVQRIKLFSIREQLRGLLDQYRATLQEGLRVIEERQINNAQLAADTQSNRYHDMLFRTTRHDYVQRYRSLFDIAQRYCYMAAKAYDYETNFDPRDRASAQPLLAEIARARILGQLGDNFPLAGEGLGGIMAKLYENFRAIEGQLGFNNFQLDTTQFSIRKEQARLTATDNDGWRNKLAAAKVADLWNVPEFRRFCRPFAPRGAPQPGLVLRFSTQVKAGYNFFGQFLVAGDSAYDPTLYATKIRAAGISFKDYPVDTLARTPYVYLVPAGMDTMTIPNSPNLDTRTWNVLDQAIPVPNPTGPADLSRPDWVASLDTLGGALGEIRRFSSFRAGVTADDPPLNVTRFIGRSVWNDSWVLIIPGQSLYWNAQMGIDAFAESVSDIQLTFETYGYSGN